MTPSRRCNGQTFLASQLIDGPCNSARYIFKCIIPVPPFCHGLAINGQGLQLAERSLFPNNWSKDNRDDNRATLLVALHGSIHLYPIAVFRFYE